MNPIVLHHTKSLEKTQSLWPARIAEYVVGLAYGADNEALFCVSSSLRTKEQVIETTRLLAAAQEMLDALEFIESEISPDEYVKHSPMALEKLKAAIALAKTGKMPSAEGPF